MNNRLPILSYDDPGDKPDAAASASPSATSASSTGAAAPNSTEVAAPTTDAASKPAQTKGILKSKSSNGRKPRQDAKRSGNHASSSDGLPDQARSNALQQLSKERKRRAFLGMLKLLEDGAQDAAQLHALIAPMSDEELRQVAEERALAGKCGNPLCSRPVTLQEPRRMFYVSSDNIHKVEGNSFCSRACSSFIQQLAVQLVSPMSRIKPAALEEYLARPTHGPKRGVAAQGGGVETMKSVIEERAPYQLIHEAEEGGRHLDAAAAASSGDSAAAAAVEGYVPHNTRGLQQQQQQQTQQQQASQQQQDAAEQEPLEVLQLQPVLRHAPKAAAAAVSSAASSSGTNSSSAGTTSASLAVACGVTSSAVPAYRADGADCSAAARAPASAPAVNSAAAAAADTTSLDSMLKAFREVQNKQLLQLQDESDNAVYSHSAAGQQTAGATAEGQLQRSSSSSKSSQSRSNEVPEAVQATADAMQPSGRRVTFGPAVEYRCPAEPHPAPQQPLLTFTVHDPGSPLELGTAADGRSSTSSSTGALIGELQLTAGDAVAAASESENESQSESESWAESHGSGSAIGKSSSGNGRGLVSSTDVHGKGPMPETWRVFFPPVLGGVGVPVKQVMKTRPVTKQQQQRGQSSSGSNISKAADTAAAKQQVAADAGQGRAGSKAQQQQHEVVAINGDNSAASAVPSSPLPACISQNVQAALRKGRTADGSRQEQQLRLGGSSSSTATAGSSQGTGGTAAAAAAVPRQRKFAPFMRERRRVVVLNESEVPGVTVQRRGARPGSSSTMHGCAAQQQQQHQQPHGHQPAQAAVQNSAHSRQQQGINAAAAAEAEAQAAGRSSTVVHAIAHGSTNIVDSSGSSDDTDGEDRYAACEPDSEQSEQEQWCYESADAGHSNSSRRSTNRSRQRHQQRHGSGDCSSSSEDECSTCLHQSNDAVDHDGLGLADDEPWSDEECLTAGDLGLSSEVFGEQGVAALDSILPFLDTKGVTVHLSEFGFMWNTLHAWISPATVAYVNSRHLQHDDNATAAAAAAGGDEASIAADSAGQSDKQQQQVPVPSLAVVQQQQAMATMLGHALPLVVEQLRICVPLSVLNKQLIALVRSFYMSRPLPALQLQQWQLVVGLMLAALAAWRLPVLQPVFAKQQQHPGSKLSEMVNALGSDVDKFMALLDLFELGV